MALGSFEAVVTQQRGTAGRAAVGAVAGLLLCAAVIAVALQPSSSVALVLLFPCFFLSTWKGREIVRAGGNAMAASSRMRRRPGLGSREIGPAIELVGWRRGFL